MGKFEEASGTVAYGELNRPILIKRHGAAGFSCDAFKGLRSASEFCASGGCRACPLIDASQFEAYEPSTPEGHLGFTAEEDFKGNEFPNYLDVRLPEGCPHAITDADELASRRYHGSSPYINGRSSIISTQSKHNAVPRSWRVRVNGDKVSLTIQYSVWFSPPDSLLLSDRRMFQTLCFNVETGQAYVSDVHFGKRHLDPASQPILNASMNAEYANGIFHSNFLDNEKEQMIEALDRTLQGEYAKRGLDISGWDTVVDTPYPESRWNWYWHSPSRKDPSFLALRNRFPGMRFVGFEDYSRFKTLVERTPAPLKRKTFTKIPRQMTVSDILRSFGIRDTKAMRRLAALRPELLPLLFEMGFYGFGDPDSVNNAVKAIDLCPGRSAEDCSPDKAMFFGWLFIYPYGQRTMADVNEKRYKDVVVPWLSAMFERHGSQKTFEMLANAQSGYALSDTLRMRRLLDEHGCDLDSIPLPLDLASQHDRCVDILNAMSGQKTPDVQYEPLYDEEDAKLEAEYHDYRFSLVSSRQELQDYGKIMHNCVGSYANDVEKGKCRIVKMYKKGAPIACIEVVSKRNNGKTPEKWEMRQCYGKCNRVLSEDADKEAVEKWMEERLVTNAMEGMRGARNPYLEPVLEFHHIARPQLQRESGEL